MSSKKRLNEDTVEDERLILKVRKPITVDIITMDEKSYKYWLRDVTLTQFERRNIDLLREEIENKKKN